MPGMHSYRCYLLGAQSHIASTSVIECRNDDEARSRAREILAEKPGCRGIEVWEQRRRVHIQLSSSGARTHWVATP
jgi:hypothetical protein